MINVLIFLLVYAASPALANEGALPRGKDSGPGVKFKVNTYTDPDGDCHSYHFNPAQGYIAFNPFSKTAYFIGKEKSLDKSNAKSYVLEVDVEKLTVKKRIMLKVKDTANLVAHKEPTEAVSIFDFNRASFACGQGTSAGVGVRWIGKQGVFKTFPKKKYKIIHSSSGQEVLDREDNSVRIFDLKSLQKRVIATLPKRGIPLFVDLNGNESFHYDAVDSGKLLKFDLKNQKLISEMILAKGMRLIQHGNRFAVGSVSPDGGKIKINTLKGWSGKTQEVFEISSSFRPLEKARVSFDFDTKIAMVSGRHREISRDWKDGEIINGKTGKVIRRIKAPEGEYVSLLEPFPYTTWVFVITKSIGDDSFSTVSLYNHQDDRVAQLAIEK